MKETGIVRSLDDLGRIVLPADLRRHMEFLDNDPVDIYFDSDTKSVIFKKHAISCVFCGDRDNIIQFRGKKICPNCVKEISIL